jgi:hypothetical protein
MYTFGNFVERYILQIICIISVKFSQSTLSGRETHIF